MVRSPFLDLYSPIESSSARRHIVGGTERAFERTLLSHRLSPNSFGMLTKFGSPTEWRRARLEASLVR